MSAKPLYEVSRAATLNGKLRLDQISLFEITAQHTAGVDNPNLAFAVEFEPVGWVPTADAVIALFPLGVNLEHMAGSQATRLARLHVTTRIVYKKTAQFTEEDVERVPDYLAINGWMHVWPYARADVQTLSTRLGFPALVLPVLLAGQTKENVVQRLVDAPRPAGAELTSKAPAASASPQKPRRPKRSTAKG